jgi:hypothetical protein
MSRRPITLFTGQWADLPFTEVCQLASQWGYDGLEIACWGDHLDVARGASDDAYLAERKHILADHGLAVYAISNHLAGQAVCDHPIDERHQGILSTRVWGDGEPEGVRQRAAEDMKDTARTAAGIGGDTVVGITSILTRRCSPPAGHDRARVCRLRRPVEPDPRRLRRGGRPVRAVHPSEIAYDTGRRSAPWRRSPPRAFGLNPTRATSSGRTDPVTSYGTSGTGFTTSTARSRSSNSTGATAGSHLPWADPRRGWDFVPPGTATPREACFCMLNATATTALYHEW